MEKSSFFNSVNGDRKYKAEDFASYFNSLITNGVFPNPSTNLQVIANNNMTVTVKAGKAWINGYVYINESDLILNIDVADGVLNRIDRVVIRFDTVGRAINARVKKGTFASTPVAPSLQRDADGYELALADIYINKGAVSVVQSTITDLRLSTDLCGVVNSLIKVDINMLTEQMQNDFNTWFNGIKNILGSDAAGNLLNQITSLNTTVNTHLADYLKHGLSGTTDATGTTTVYILTPNPALSSYAKGLAIEIFFDKANTGSSTINISGLGAKNLKKQDGTAYASGELKTNTPYRFVFNGTDFLADSSVGYYGTAGASQTLFGYTLGVPTGVVDGTMPNNGAINVTQTASGQVTTIPAGYTPGGSVTNNITIASLGGKSFASSSKTVQLSADSTDQGISVSGLSFQPKIIILETDSGSGYGVTKFRGYVNTYFSSEYTRSQTNNTTVVSGTIPYGNNKINSDGFWLSVPSAIGTTVNWYAIG